MNLPPINLWNYGKPMELDILEALNEITGKDKEDVRKMLKDGMLSISDGVFISALVRLGVDEEVIQWRLSEPVDTRLGVIEFYEKN